MQWKLHAVVLARYNLNAVNHPQSAQNQQKSAPKLETPTKMQGRKPTAFPLKCDIGPTGAREASAGHQQDPAEEQGPWRPSMTACI